MTLKSTSTDAALQTWMEGEILAEAMIPLVGRLYRDNHVIANIHGRSLVNKSPFDILKAHRFARHIDGVELPPAQTLPLLQALTQLELGAASLDVARLNALFQDAGEQDLDAFLRRELAELVGRRGTDERAGTDVVLYGFGRIGRLLARILIDHSGGGQGLRLRAIVVRNGGAADLTKRASLLRRDSVHGPFDGTITVDRERNIIQANGTAIQVIYSNDPATIDYTSYGIHDALIVDNTGRWRDEAGLSEHLKSPGAARVLLTAPGKGALKNIVFGINHASIAASDTIITAASCTTNAITPVLKVLNDEYGIVHGHVETVHSFTNDQNLTDNFHKGDRRGRSAALNMVLTETGAAQAVAKALPELAGKLTGNSIRVPTPNVSMAILNLTLERATTKDAVNAYLRDVSLNSAFRKQIDYIDSPEVVSSDFVGSRRAGIVDGLATISTEKNLVLYLWYDNEFGYSCQVVRVMEEMAGVHPRQYPAVAVSAP